MNFNKDHRGLLLRHRLNGSGKGWEMTHRSRAGRLYFLGLYWFVERLKASWVNKRRVSKVEFDEIQRGN